MSNTLRQLNKLSVTLEFLSFSFFRLKYEIQGPICNFINFFHQKSKCV